MKKIIIYAHVNLNIIDGSAIWLKSLIEMLNITGKFITHVILKQPVTKESLVCFENVTYIIPKDNMDGFSHVGHRLNEDEAISAIAAYDQQFGADLVIIRQLDWSKISALPEVTLKKTYIYNISALGKMIEESHELLDHVGGVLAQTEHLLNYIREKSKCYSVQSFIMPPMIPDLPVVMPKLNHKIVYAGKFTAMWQVKEMIDSFKRIRLFNDKIEFHIAGDKFDSTVNDVELKDLLENTENLFWHKRMSRNSSMLLMSECSVGLGFRSPELKESMEISTKLLEYCMAGLPVIVNSSKIHRELLGVDYPYFANSIEEFEKVLLSIFEDEDLYFSTANKCRKAVAEYGYIRSGERFVNFFYDNN